MFHAFGNNPVKYVDPDGRADEDVDIRQLLYEAADFIIKNAETEDEKILASAVSYLMNSRKVQFDDLANRFPRYDSPRSSTRKAFFDINRNTLTGNKQEIIVIDKNKAQEGGLEGLIGTLTHESVHKVQYDNGRIDVNENNDSIIRFNRQDGRGFLDYQTDLEYEAYYMEFTMLNKYRSGKGLDTYRLPSWNYIKEICRRSI